MQKVFHFFVELVYWLQLLLAPFLFFGIIGVIVFINFENSLWLLITFTSIGTLTGIYFAERIRKKYGCSKYVSRIFSAPDLQPDKEEESNKK